MTEKTAPATALLPLHSLRGYCRMLFERHGVAISPPGLLKWEKSGRLQLEGAWVGKRRFILDTADNDHRVRVLLMDLKTRRDRPDWLLRAEAMRPKIASPACVSNDPLVGRPLRRHGVPAEPAADP